MRWSLLLLLLREAVPSRAEKKEVFFTCCLFVVRCLLFVVWLLLFVVSSCRAKRVALYRGFVHLQESLQKVTTPHSPTREKSGNNIKAEICQANVAYLL